MATTAYLPAGLMPPDTGVSQPGQSTSYMSAGIPGVELVTAGLLERKYPRGKERGILRGVANV